MENVARLKGSEAVAYAEEHGVPLCKYADPTEGAREDLTVDAARAILAEDPSLIYVDAVSNESNRERWIEAAGGPAKAVETENTLLAIGRDFLPPCAVAVREGEEPTEEYWAWLLSQLPSSEVTETNGLESVSGVNDDGTEWTLRIGDRVESDADGGDAGRIGSFVDSATALVYWDSGVATPVAVSELHSEVVP